MLEAGAELNELVATKVMGLEECPLLVDYSGNMVDAWKVVIKMRHFYGFDDFKLFSPLTGQLYWTALFQSSRTPDHVFASSGWSACLAICGAALKMVENTAGTDHHSYIRKKLENL